MLPLNGVKVLDLTRALAGPFCSMILADLGADVIKAEAMPDGDLTRNSAPLVEGISTYFLAINRNKRALALDFRSDDGLRILQRLARSVDIIVENFKPGVMAAMGLTYESIKADNPKVIFASITGFGTTGPLGMWPGVDQIAQGMSGLMSVTGHTSSGPTRVGIPIGDILGGMWCALGIQAAIIERQVSGVGQRVETSLLAGLVGVMSLQAQRYLTLDEVPEPAGNHHPTSVPYGMYRAIDGPFNMSATTQKMWHTLCDLLEVPELANHPDYATASARRINRNALEASLNERFATRSRNEWIALLTSAGLPAGNIYDMKEVFNDPQVQHCRMVEEIDHPALGRLQQLALPIKLESLAGGSVRTPPPALGQHSSEILAEFGYPSIEIESLITRGIILVP